MVTWFAGLFYLPRLFVYHAMAGDSISIDRFKVMERKLFFGIMTPSAVLTIGFGMWLWFGYGFSGGWLHAKVFIVLLLVIYHVSCGKFLLDFERDRSVRGHLFYRWFNEIPVAMLVLITILVIVKPF